LHRFAWCVPVTFRDMGPKGDFREGNHDRSNRATEQLNQRDPSRRLHRSDVSQMPANSVDFILTDPPYLVTTATARGAIPNDVDDAWLKSAMAQVYRVLKQDRVAVMFYG
jgi:hypothetical protein